MIHVKNLSLAYGDQVIFDNISFTLDEQDRVGLVGRNGTGKSTLFKMLTGLETADSGTISVTGNKTIAYMPQEVVLASNKSILDETVSAIKPLARLQETIAKLEALIKESGDTVDHYILEQYGLAHEELTVLQPDAIKARAERLLTGLGFTHIQMSQPVSQLSVGWKMRVVLAQLLLQDADFYFFDEPTNHLDITAKDWFMNFLQESSFGFLLVSHERYFMDRVCNQILELELGKAYFYQGSYADYEIEKEARIERLVAARAQQDREIKRKQDWVDQNRAKATKARQAQSILKELERIERIEIPPSPKTVGFSFPDIERSGKIVLTVQNIAHRFGERQLFQNVSCTIERGDKVALIAPNGVGKTTLFNIIVGKIARQQGSIEFGYNVQSTIFAQDQTQALSLNDTILHNVMMACPRKSEAVVRSLLGAFLFSGDDVQKKVKVLSGGEKNRVGMAIVLLQDANFLLLDEPTNHLDIPSKDILLKALQSYTGTILFVSHDHDFINNLANRIIALSPTGAHSYHGNYDSYKYQANLASPTPSAAKAKQATADVTQKPAVNDLKKQSAKLERAIEQLEKKINTVSMQFADLDYGTPEFEKAQRTLSELKKELENTSAQWEEVLEQL